MTATLAAQSGGEENLIHGLQPPHEISKDLVYISSLAIVYNNIPVSLEVDHLREWQVAMDRPTKDRYIKLLHSQNHLDIGAPSSALILKEIAEPGIS